MGHRFDPDILVLTVVLEHQATKQKLQLVGNMSGYKAIPPAWMFVDPETGEHKKSAYPKGELLPETGGASIFIDFEGRPTICAPFKRLAYGEAKGPHQDWVQLPAGCS